MTYTDGEKLIFAAAYARELERLTFEAQRLDNQLAGIPSGAGLYPLAYAVAPWDLVGQPWSSRDQWIVFNALASAIAIVENSRSFADTFSTADDLAAFPYLRAALSQIFGIDPPV